MWRKDALPQCGFIWNQLALLERIDCSKVVKAKVDVVLDGGDCKLRLSAVATMAALACTLIATARTATCALWLSTASGLLTGWPWVTVAQLW